MGSHTHAHIHTATYRFFNADNNMAIIKIRQFVADLTVY